jgi:hypothetical protein
VLLHWEDLWRGGDRDYNDAVITITPGGTPSATIGDSLRIPGAPEHDVPVTFTLEPTANSRGSNDEDARGSSQGELGIFIVDDDEGRVDGILPGSPEYLQAVLASITRQVVFETGDPVGTEVALVVPGGSLIAWYYIPEGTADEVLENNPENEPDSDPFALFSFDAANPDHEEHFRWFGPEFGGGPVSDGLQLHILDQLFSSRSRFDDLLVAIGLP